jgi:hypothetical protein
MNPTTTPDAESIEYVLVASGASAWRVEYSLETAHHAVAVVKLRDLTDFSLAVFDGGRWVRARRYSAPSIAEALRLVPAAVFEYFA